MALRVWVPFVDGTARDLGLAGLKFTFADSTKTSSNNSGKIGKCFYNNTLAAGGLLSTTNITLPVTQSWFCWAKFDLFYSASSLTGVISQHDPTNKKNMGITVKYVSATTGYLSCSTGTGSSRTYNTYTGSTLLNTGIWYHLGFTHDGSTIKFYVNGVLDGTTSYSGQSQSAAPIRLFGWNIANSTYSMKGYLNDVRIYDHCLSPKEIKELSKGLVLHYPLNDTLVLTNAFNYPTFNTSSSNGGWSHWGPSGATASWSLNTNKDYIFNKNNIYSHKFLHTGGSYYIVFQTPAFEGGYRSALAIIKMEGGEYPHDIVFGQNATVGTNPPTTFTALGDGFYLMKHEGFRQDGSNNLVSILINNNITVYISEVYLENDRQVCSNLFKTTNVVYDSSGYNNNGTIAGTLTTSLDTPRYDKCTYISEGVSNYIVSPTIYIPGDAITVSIWIKSSTSPINYHMPFESESQGYVEMSISSSVALRGGLYINGTRYVQNVSGHVLDGKWHMITITYDGATIKRYVDGVLGNSTSVSGTLNATAQKYYFGKYGTNNSYFSKEMYLSDARLYTTALSADDVKALYNEAAFIDHKGNVGCYLFYEDTDSQITKTGQIRTEEFEEISDLSDGVAKVYELKIECNQLIEI